MKEEFTSYAIYDHPKDYPNEYVVRKWVVNLADEHRQPEAREIVFKSENLAEVEDHLRNLGLTHFQANVTDPVILSEWI